MVEPEIKLQNGGSREKIIVLNVQLSFTIGYFVQFIIDSDSGRRASVKRKSDLEIFHRALTNLEGLSETLPSLPKLSPIAIYREKWRAILENRLHEQFEEYFDKLSELLTLSFEPMSQLVFDFFKPVPRQEL